ncbi:calcium-binding protein [Kineosporia babensis]|uniref:Calcium-binding protein n=1 Tax=Kineosporia babensis TaxID=499548 RepID=A0A9X1ND32_9ACTN|nr:calcium-binding protein [Kineosporia babensis]MCD5311885.1 hypothetical protein [Kineosporia babensis]
MSVSRNVRLFAGAATTTSLVVAGVVGIAGNAQAQETEAVVSLTNDLKYQAVPGQVNNLTVTRRFVEGPPDDGSAYGQATYQYRLDDVVPIDATTDAAAAERCIYPTASDRTVVECTWTVDYGQDPGTISNFRLGDKNDKVRFNDQAGDHYENDLFHLGAGNDSYDGTLGKVDGSSIFGGEGDDSITTGEQIGDVASISGGNGNDTIRTYGEWNGAHGDAGNDKLYGGVGRQDFFGGPGNDLIYGGKGADVLRGEQGNDTLYGNSGADTIYGNSGNDKIYGGPGTDTVSGGPGKDFIKMD